VLVRRLAVTAIDVFPGLGAFAPWDRAAARVWARSAGVVLLAASMLAAAADQRHAVPFWSVGC